MSWVTDLKIISLIFDVSLRCPPGCGPPVWLELQLQWSWESLHSAISVVNNTVDSDDDNKAYRTVPWTMISVMCMFVVCMCVCVDVCVCLGVSVASLRWYTFLIK